MRLSDLPDDQQAALKRDGLTWSVVEPSVRAGATVEEILEYAHACRVSVARVHSATSESTALEWLLRTNVPAARRAGAPHEAILMTIDSRTPWTDAIMWFNEGLPLDVFLAAAAAHGDLRLPRLLLSEGIAASEVLTLDQGLRYNTLALDLLTRLLRDGWLTPDEALDVARRANLSMLHDVTSVTRRKDPVGTPALATILASHGYSAQASRQAALQAAGTPWASTLVQLVVDGMPLDKAVTAARLLEGSPPAEAAPTGSPVKVKSRTSRPRSAPAKTIT